ncbi:MAG: hypothetical protein R3267_10855 [Paenisporosarcina sp.]|nr:hypothetical protein [Paenisporosarcina sp.]
MMELSIKEQALIKTFRDINEVPANVLLMYAVGLEANADKVAKFDSKQAKVDYDKANLIWEQMKHINTLK